MAEQDNSIVQIRDKLNKSRQETQDMRYQYEEAVRAHHEDKER